MAKFTLFSSPTSIHKRIFHFPHHVHKSPVVMCQTCTDKRDAVLTSWCLIRVPTNMHHSCRQLTDQVNYVTKPPHLSWTDHEMLSYYKSKEPGRVGFAIKTSSMTVGWVGVEIKVDVEAGVGVGGSFLLVPELAGLSEN